MGKTDGEQGRCEGGRWEGGRTRWARWTSKTREQGGSKVGTRWDSKSGGKCRMEVDDGGRVGMTFAMLIYRIQI